MAQISAILTDPDPDKSIPVFESAVAELLRRAVAELTTIPDWSVCADAAKPVLPFDGAVVPAGFEAAQLFDPHLHRVSMQGCTFLGDIDLQGADFSGGLSLEGAIFKGSLSFWKMAFDYLKADEKTTIAGQIMFQDCVINRLWLFNTSIDSDFFLSTCTVGGGIIEDVVFKGRADFTKTTFEDTLECNRVDWGPDCSFSAATFGETAFRGCHTTGDVSFATATFQKPTTIDSLQVAGFVDIRSVKIDSGVRVRLRLCDMSRTLLLNSDPSSFDFQAVTWPEKNGRLVVADELHWPPPDSPGLVHGNQYLGAPDRRMLEVLYRQLKRSYDSLTDYDTAGHFHVGEFEAKLARLGRWKLNHLLIVGYRRVSWYGERWARPLAWLCCWLLFFMFAEPFAGVVIQGRRIKYPAGWAHESATSVAHDLELTMLHGVQVATGIRLPVVVYLSAWTQALVTIDHIAGPAFIALFLLGLRRQLKR